MAKGPKYGQEVKLTGFTRGGIPVGRRTGAKSKKVVNQPGNTNFAEPIAWGIAGGLTVLGTGLIGTGAAGMRSLKTK